MANDFRDTTISVADEVAAAEANLRAAQERLNAARMRYSQSLAQGQDSVAHTPCGENPLPGATCAYAQDAAANARTFSAACTEAVPFPAGGQSAANRAHANFGDNATQAPHEARYVPSKDHVAAALLALFLGALGVHKFYMGRTNAGFIMLAITVIGGFVTLGAAVCVMVLIGIVEGVIYLNKSQADFERVYIAGKRSWF